MISTEQWSGATSICDGIIVKTRVVYMILFSTVPLRLLLVKPIIINILTFVTKIIIINILINIVTLTIIIINISIITTRSVLLTVD